MARVTVEDCIDKIPNRFDLVILAAYRARQLCSGAPAEVSRGDDKNAVVALREIAENKLSLEKLREGVVKNLVKSSDQIESDEELIAIFKEEQENKFEESLSGVHVEGDSSADFYKEENDEEDELEDEELDDEGLADDEPSEEELSDDGELIHDPDQQ